MISIKKLSVCFLVCVFATNTIAVPTPKQSTSTTNNVSPFGTDLGESIKRFTHEVESSFKNFTHNVEYMFHSLEKIFRSTVEGGFVNAATWAVDIVGRLEFLVMADGSHFMMPLSGKSELEEEYKTIAVAVSRLLRNLKTMERTDRLITNVTRKVVTEDLEHHFKKMKSSEEKFFKTMLHVYMETMDHKFKSDEVLATDYTKQKSVAKEEVKRDPKMAGPLIKIWETKEKSKYVSNEEIKKYLQDKEVLLQGFVNKLFLKSAVKHLAMIFNTTEQHRYFMARAMIQKAESSGYDSEVNEVYHKALKRAGDVQYMYERDEIIAGVLFDTIESGLMMDKHLYTEVEGMMKQIEVRTSYDFGMFHIDFSPL